MGYEDVDYCLRAWQAGFQVVYAPSAQLHHHESITRGTEVGERERKSQRVFWKRWGAFFDERQVLHRRRQAAGRLRHRGHGRRRWPSRRVRAPQRADRARATTRSCGRWAASLTGSICDAPSGALTPTRSSSAALAPLEAIKVATWWKTSDAVWRASVLNGPARSTSSRTSRRATTAMIRTRRYEVLNSYRPEFRYLTISEWNREQLRELGLEAALIPPGIDLGQLPPAARSVAPRRHAARARAVRPAEEPAADARRPGVACPSRVPNCACSGQSQSWRASPASATSRDPPTPRSTSCSTRRRCSCRHPRTRVSACRFSSRWPPAAPWSAPTLTATATSASMARTA